MTAIATAPAVGSFTPAAPASAADLLGRTITGTAYPESIRAAYPAPISFDSVQEGLEYIVYGRAFGAR